MLFKTLLAVLAASTAALACEVQTPGDLTLTICKTQGPEMHFFVGTSNPFTVAYRVTVIYSTKFAPFDTDKPTASAVKVLPRDQGSADPAVMVVKGAAELVALKVEQLTINSSTTVK